MKKTAFALLFIFLINNSLFSQDSKAKQTAQKEVQFPASDAFAKSNLTYKIINAANNTYCYDIYADGRLMIHQPSIPGMPGTDGFKTKAQAESVAKLVISKIKKGEMPPSVTIEEMKKLKAV